MCSCRRQVEAPGRRAAWSPWATRSPTAMSTWTQPPLARLPCPPPGRPRPLAVLNAGISGARLLQDKMGSNALARFDRDVLAQPGVAAVVLYRHQRHRLERHRRSRRDRSGRPCRGPHRRLSAADRPRAYTRRAHRRCGRLRRSKVRCRTPRCAAIRRRQGTRAPGRQRAGSATAASSTRWSISTR